MAALTCVGVARRRTLGTLKPPKFDQSSQQLVALETRKQSTPKRDTFVGTQSMPQETVTSSNLGQLVVARPQSALFACDQSKVSWQPLNLEVG